jgi:hypothetical protein
MASMVSSPAKAAYNVLPSDAVTEPASHHSKRPSLLPAFGDADADDLLSSSPFPAAKRKFGHDSPSAGRHHDRGLKYYPTPVPTSSTGAYDFSSPRHAHPPMHRTVSALSERIPLGAVPTIDLPANGEVVRMGRSSNSADYQLSTNRLISRVHVQAAYHAPITAYPSGYIEVECLGWNGAKIHCRGRVFDLAKGDTYMSENPETEIMLDVQDTRVVIAWPVIPMSKFSWESEEEGMPTPTRNSTQAAFDSSPPVAPPRSPVSQSPIRQPVFAGPSTTTATQSGPVQVFEDANAPEEGSTLLESAEQTFIRPAESFPASNQDSDVHDPKASITSSFADDDYSDNDEENDPVVHSFGPFGQNLLGGLASFSTATPRNVPRPPRAPLASPSPRRPAAVVRFKDSPIRNHVINQLAYSRVHSHPLSTIHGNLPTDLKACIAKSGEDKGPDRSGSVTPLPQLSHQDLKRILDDTPCVGEIPRSGKDAAGKPLESEFYYVPEMDPDQMRRETITAGMRSTGLRSVRKTHKVLDSVVTILQRSLTSPSNTTGNALASEPFDSYFACHSSPLPSPILQTTQHTFSNIFCLHSEAFTIPLFRRVSISEFQNAVPASYVPPPLRLAYTEAGQHVS